MAKDKLTDYDATASNNTDVGGISVAEGMLPSGVNNAIREQMSHLADFASGTSGVDVLKLQDDTDTNSIKLQAPASVTADTTFTLPDGDGSADQVLKTDGSGQLGWADRHANPSLIINGAMQVAQRGTSSTSDSYSTVDRWRPRSLNTDQLVHTFSQSTDAPSGFSTSFKANVDTAETTLDADESWKFEQRIEGQNLQMLAKGTPDAKALTVSFWVKSSTTGTYICELDDRDNTRAYSQAYTISSANTWEYKTLTYAGDTTGTFDNDNDQSLRLTFALAMGSNLTSGTLTTGWASRVDANRFVGQTNLMDTANNYWQITGVKLEVGPTATDFVHRSYGEELALCQRYYNAVADNSFMVNFVVTNNYGTRRGSSLFPQRMRSAPSVTVSVSDGSISGASTVDGVIFSQTGASSTSTPAITNVTFDSEL